MIERMRHWSRRVLIVGVMVALYSGTALAHEGGHNSAAPIDLIAVTGFFLGTALVGGGVLADRADRLPRGKTDAAVLLGAVLVVLSIPLFWS